MNNQKRTALLNALLTEPNIKKACELANVSEATAYNYLKNDEFSQELEEARAKTTTDTINYIKGNLTRCSEELFKVIYSELTPPQVKVSAIKLVFDSVASLQNSKLIEARLDDLERDQDIYTSLVSSICNYMNEDEEE